MGRFVFLLAILISAESLVVTLKEPTMQSGMELRVANSTGDTSTTLPTKDSREFPTTVSSGDNTTKHPTFYECGQLTLDPGDFVIINGTDIIEAYNMSFNSSFYELKGDTVKICMPTFDSNNEEENGNRDPPFMYITTVGLVISITCLLLHLLAFSVVKDLRNLPGYHLAALCLSLLMGYTSFLLGFVRAIASCYTACVISAACSQFFMLGSLLWMNVMAFDVLRSIMNATGKLRLVSTRFTIQKFSLSCLYSWGISLLFVTVALIFDQVDGIPSDFRPHFGEDICWFGNKKPLLIFFGGPVILLIVMNAIFFGISAYTIFVNRMKAEDVHGRVIKRNLVIYSRLGVIMGLTWIVGIFSGVLNNVVFWYLFDILNSLQGLFIFLAFTCTKKVRNAIRHRFGLTPRRRSYQITFQTYCNLGASCESQDNIDGISRTSVQPKLSMTV